MAHKQIERLGVYNLILVEHFEVKCFKKGGYLGSVQGSWGKATSQQIYFKTDIDFEKAGV